MRFPIVPEIAAQARTLTPNKAERPYDDSQVIHLRVSSNAYHGLAAAIGDHNHVRLAYDGATLEIMSPGLKHEQITRLVATILIYAFDEWEIDYEDVGATTFETEADGGFEGDASFYIAKANGIRGLDKIDLLFNPAPDLILEIDITNRRIDKMKVYSKLGVGEFWRFNEKDGLEAFVLDNGAYTRIDVSRAVHGLPLAIFAGFIDRLIVGEKRLAIVADVKRWLRDNKHLHAARNE